MEVSPTWAAARAMVAIWLRSPHSPRNVKMKAWTKTGPNRKAKKLRAPSTIVPLCLRLWCIWCPFPSSLPPSSIASKGITSPSLPTAPVPSNTASSSISSSTSRNSSWIFSFPAFIARPSCIIFHPKNRKRVAAAVWVHLLGMRVGRICPIAAERQDITTNEPNAPANTTALGCLIARMAAMRKVLSPISDATIIANDCTNTLWEIVASPDCSVVAAAAVSISESAMHSQPSLGMICSEMKERSNGCAVQRWSKATIFMTELELWPVFWVSS